MNKPFVCPSAVLSGLPWCLVPGIQGHFHNNPCHPCISIFAASLCVSVRTFGCLLFTGLIMQGLGKTERGDQGRDIDLTSLRSTMPASGPLQVSAPRKKPIVERQRQVETEWTEIEKEKKRKEKYEWWRLDRTFCLLSNGLY